MRRFPQRTAVRVRGWLRQHRARLWDVLRMTTSTAVAFALGAALDLAESFWAVIAALIVTQSSLGGTLKAGLEQFLGSVFGAVWGAAVTLAIPHESVAMKGLALIIAVAPLTVLTTVSPGFRIAPITAILVLLSSMGIAMGPLGFAVERLLEIGLGCAVGLTVSYGFRLITSVGRVWATSGSLCRCAGLGCRVRCSAGR